ncbi:TonB-dependent receptor plug domain-containing protein [Polyangium mundeleinium]|uniref:TonB-dependent receptor n=1 Tax=Polyangium mundeleinium TaxID=2995306 RepID=A0ABT5EDF8_9BACT|nr:TonB-dependent receptor [Polyangium mundeleinium]MDC0739850.1 TonB-dependent receptor [Polyangium mundeleinium]
MGEVLRRAGLGLALATSLAAGPALAEAPPPAEPALAEPAPALAEPAPEPAPEPPPPQPIEVTVEGDKAPAGSVSLKRRDIREMPGVLGDPYRAIEVQPGVTPTASGLPYYYIRGAPPGNIGFFYDGVRVPLLFHVGAGPSVIPAPLVSGVTLHMGPYPADIGRLAGAAVEAEAAPFPNEWKGEGAFRFVDVGGVVEGPIGDKTTVLVGGHYAFGGHILSALIDNVEFGYGDYQARVSRRIGERGRLTALAFGAWDYLATTTTGDASGAKDVLLDADFHRLDVRYDHDFDSGAKLRAAVMLGLDRSRQVGAESANNWKIGARLRGSKPIGGGKALLRGGIDLMVDRYDIVHKEPCDISLEACASGPLGELDEAFRALFPSRWDTAVGAWADALVVLSDRATITPGLRVDHYTSMGNTALAIDPKITGRFGVGERVRIVPSFGVASQLPGFAPLPALQIGGITGGLQRALQSSFGAEVKLSPIPVEISGSLFRQVTFNLTDPIGSDRGTNLGAGRFLSRSTGDAYGLELSARGALRKDLLFLASYTLSRSTRTSKSGLTTPSAVDRTHVAHVALLYDFGKGWKAGVRHVFYSGFPAQEAGSGAVVEDPPRVRPFYRLDLRVSRRWKVGQTGFVSLVLDMQNATLSKEVFDVTCARGICQPRLLGPITIPQLSVEAGF